MIYEYHLLEASLGNELCVSCGKHLVAIGAVEVVELTSVSKNHKRFYVKTFNPNFKQDLLLNMKYVSKIEEYTYNEALGYLKSIIIEQ